MFQVCFTSKGMGEVYMPIDTIIGIVVLATMAVISFVTVRIGLLMLDDIDEIGR